MSIPSYREQVDLISNLITKRSITEPIVYSLYEELAAKIDSKEEEKLLSLAFTHPFLIPLLDAGLVFIRPTSELRRRIYITFSLLESQPRYADEFLPGKTHPLQLIGVIAVGVRAVFRAVAGIIIIKIGRL